MLPVDFSPPKEVENKHTLAKMYHIWSLPKTVK